MKGLQSLSHSFIPHFLPVTLSSSGKASLLQDEIEVLIQNFVFLYCDEDKHKSPTNEEKLGELIITTHRLLYLFQTGTSREGIALNLFKIKNMTQKKAGIVASAKLDLTITGVPETEYIRLSFKGNKSSQNMQQTAQVLQDQIKKQSWTKTASPTGNNPLTPPGKKEEFSTKSAGVGGIMRRIESESSEQQQNISEAFSDLNSLMDKARELVGLAEKYIDKMKTQQQQDQSAEDAKDQEQFSDILLTMGIGQLSSVVSKHTTGALFHQELSRQLVDFFSPKVMDQFHGMLLLTDAYCLYNRARVTDLISPDDMMKACSLFPKLGLPLALKKFDSGVCAISSLKYNDTYFNQKLKEVIESQEQKCALAVDIAKLLEIPLIIANEQLLAAEKAEILCRDVTFKGVYFYINFFKTL